MWSCHLGLGVWKCAKDDRLSRNPGYRCFVGPEDLDVPAVLAALGCMARRLRAQSTAGTARTARVVGGVRQQRGIRRLPIYREGQGPLTAGSHRVRNAVTFGQKSHKFGVTVKVTAQSTGKQRKLLHCTGQADSHKQDLMRSINN